ncbi:MAG TPA: bifunctional diaminohydroxyphosphoribosylaminopyrimidine deaminase/5-amino-6-(5-phosphoribosylamino)uracil reductase RibD [Flavobacteriaceae bacterium]|nr:bifunctional diaminohydroxyphosphoribosylaminopyrimidine deaminase/5-amino-6-(5-phosphoribosylamino)uracil reductase RibD [Flavobacteriaceae bacterium]
MTFENVKVREKYMQRCVELAQKGLGKTYPNPLVGSVIVHDEKIIGEGWHQKAGTPHAEVNAINSVADETLLKKSTLYVNLEPCSHYGKTPPCSDLIIAKGIKKVIIGIVDPFAAVSGRGIKKLLAAGCEVSVGMLEDECKHLNRRFLVFNQQKRPYIILKWAQTKDGFIAPKHHNTGKPVWISGEESRQLVHKWRTEEQAILVGTNTVLKDNPKLDARLWKGSNPVRVVLDREGKIPSDFHVLDGRTKSLILCENPKENRNNLIYEPVDFKENLIAQICEILHRHHLQSLIVEGGSKTLQAFIDAGLWDEARIFTGKTLFKEGVKAPVFSGKPFLSQKIGEDSLQIFFKKKHSETKLTRK